MVASRPGAVARHSATWRRRGVERLMKARRRRSAREKTNGEWKHKENFGPARKVTVQQTKFVVKRSGESKSTQNKEVGKADRRCLPLTRPRERVYIRETEPVRDGYSTRKVS